MVLLQLGAEGRMLKNAYLFRNNPLIEAKTGDAVRVEWFLPLCLYEHSN